MITAVIYLPRILQVLHLSDILKFILEIIEIGNLKGRVLEYLKEGKKEEIKREAGKIGMHEVDKR